MPAFFKFVTIDTGSISAGGSVERAYVPEDDFILHRLQMFDTGGSPIRNVDVTITLDGYALTDTVVPASIFDGRSSEVAVLDVSLGARKTLRISLKNNETAARNIRIVLEIWK